MLDLLPDRSAGAGAAPQVLHPRGARSLSSHLKSRLGLDGIKAGAAARSARRATEMHDADSAGRERIKALPLALVRRGPIDEAISTAGGVRFEALDDSADAARAARRVLRRRDARLGGADRRLPAHGLHGQRRGGGRGVLAWLQG